MSYESVNPYDGTVLQTFEEMTDGQLESALATAAACFEIWNKKSYGERAVIVARAAVLMRERSEEFARPVTLEMGKLITQARGEVELSADIIDYYAKNAETFLAPEALHPTTGEAEIQNAAFGVLFGVEPWNFPYYQLARFAAPNLMAGNVVIVKHAGCVPQCAIAFEKLWLDAGAPAGAYTNLLISYDQVNRVIDDPRIKGIALTGSVEAGKAVAARAGLNLKKSTMELGGADAFVVLADADMAKTVKWAVFGRHWNGGQVCVSSKRMIIEDAVYDDFLTRYSQGVAALRMGDPFDPATTLAPLSSQKAADDLKTMIEKAVEHGATATPVGPDAPNQGAFVQPTILTDVGADNPARHWEFFGPVSMLFRAADEDDAVRIANDTIYGLAGGVWSGDPERAKRVARRLRTGQVEINGGKFNPMAPFGGYKQSGNGRELGKYGLEEYLEVKAMLT